MHQFTTAIFIVIFLSAAPAATADPVTGPVVENYGPVYAVPEGSFNLDPEQDYKVIMDVGKGPDDPVERNRYVESAARFLNMNARNGLRVDKLQLALVLHGSAGRAALSDAAYEAQFGAPNPDKAMLEELRQAGVDIYLCGQTAAHRGFAPDQLLPQVTLAVSAMTVHVRLQQEGYRAILF